MRIIAISRGQIKEVLLRGGVDKVFTAENGEEALSILEMLHGEDTADIILVEKFLADMIGERKIRELKLKKPLPLIVIMKTEINDVVAV